MGQATGEDVANNQANQSSTRFATDGEPAIGSILNAIAHMERDQIDPDYTAPAGVVHIEDWPRTWEKFDKLLDTRDFDGFIY